LSEGEPKDGGQVSGGPNRSQMDAKGVEKRSQGIPPKAPTGHGTRLSQKLPIMEVTGKSRPPREEKKKARKEGHLSLQRGRLTWGSSKRISRTKIGEELLSNAKRTICRLEKRESAVTLTRRPQGPMGGQNFGQYTKRDDVEKKIRSGGRTKLIGS